MVSEASPGSHQMPEDTSSSAAATHPAKTPPDIQEGEEAEEEQRHETQKKNLDAFFKMLPDLLKKHKSKHALIVDGKLERTDTDLQSLIDYAYSRFPNSLSLIQLIQEKLPRVHLGSPKLLAP